MNKLRIEKKLTHYVGKAIADYKMISRGDNVLLCLSGGKDSYVMAHILRLLRMRSRDKFQLAALIIDQSFPGSSYDLVVKWLENNGIECHVVKKNIYGILQSKLDNKTSMYCPLCSRLRRGTIYQFARENGFNKVALGHHRDDLIISFLMSAFYNGAIRSMPPKLLTDDKKLVVIRPMVYCQEVDIANYASLLGFPIVKLAICAFKENPMRKQLALLVADLAKQNPKIPSNIFRALQNVVPNQLMDKKLWNFESITNLEL